MEHFTHCPLPAKGGGDCWGEPHPASRYGLCVTHWRKTVEDWCADIPAEKIRCQNCYLYVLLDPVDAHARKCTECGADLDLEFLVGVRDLELSLPAHGTVVYYIRFGDRIKIGFTGYFRGRLSSLPCDEVLAVEPGGRADEKRRHQMFAHLLVDGQREWFHMAPELMFHVATVRDREGEPLARAVEIHREVAAG